MLYGDWYMNAWECSDELLYFYGGWEDSLADDLLDAVADVWLYYDSCFDETDETFEYCEVEYWVQDTIELFYGYDITSVLGTSNLSEDLWYYIAEDMEYAWLLDESDDWMAPFFDLEWALDGNWSASDWDQLQADFDAMSPFDEDDTFFDFMTTYGYYGSADDSLWSLAESLIEDDGIIRDGLEALGILDEGDSLSDFSFGSLFAGTTNAFTLAMALVSILIQFKN